jgi:CHAT domain-containing protein
MATARRAVLAEYYTHEDQILLFIGDSDHTEPHVVKIRIPLKEVQRFATEHFVASADENKVRQLDLDEWQSTLAPLVEPIAAFAEEGDVLWFVPHDVLHHLPLHALKVEGRYLAERHPTCYTSSSSVMKYCKGKRKGTRNRALVLGDSRQDLAYACEEAQVVAELFNTVAHVGKDATKALVRSQLETEGADLDVWHFACHIYFDREQPLKSGIVLAPEASSDPQRDDDREWNLTAEEIFGLQFHADLVVLSGCTSGLSDRKAGDELIGLTRALTYAGTPSVIASLWVVDDLSTGLLMQRFYEELRMPSESAGRQPVTKSEALRKAQAHVRGLTASQVIEYCDRRLARLPASGPSGRRDVFERGRARATRPVTPMPSRAPVAADVRPFEHPYFWAPFVLIGDWN